MSIIMVGNRSIFDISSLYLVKESFLSFIDDIQVNAQPLCECAQTGFDCINLNNGPTSWIAINMDGSHRRIKRNGLCYTPKDVCSFL